MPALGALLRLAAPAIGVLLVSPADAFGSDRSRVSGRIFVSPKGKDTNPGTRHLPLATVQRAVDIARPGQVIYLRGGVYRPTATTLFNKAGKKNARFEIRGSDQVDAGLETTIEHVRLLQGHPRFRAFPGPPGDRR